MSSEYEVKPFIPAHRTLPEITVKGVILAVILTIVLASANAYLGLKVGTTVSASIPAAVISMGILRCFRHSNILENNIVQTSASIGEAMTAGMAFLLPALIILHYWMGFHYWETVTIGLLGALLGVSFGVPIRRVLLDDRTLHFPEGTAIGAVLKASAGAKTDLKFLVNGGIVGAIIAFCQTGLKVLTDSYAYWVSKDGALWGFGVGFSPALIAAGYIIGINVAIAIFVGIAIGWICGMPILSHVYSAIVPGMSTGDIADAVWSSHIRYMGVGTMLVGGIWTVITLTKPILVGIKTSLSAVSRSQAQNAPAILRTERDMSFRYVLIALIAVVICVFFYLMHAINPQTMGLSNNMRILFSVVGALYVFVIGFILCSVAGYFAGLIGSTNCPGSGLIVSGLLFISLIFLGIFKAAGGHIHQAESISLAVIAILVTAFLATSLVITNETIQDLKAGQIVGATPWKQQVMLLIGGVVAALTLPLVLQLLFDAYGMGGVYPRPGMDPSQMLAAPQAAMMAMVAKGVITHKLEWSMIFAGGIVAIVCIVIDEFLKKFYHKRFPVLAVGLGIYLPLAASTPAVIGGVLKYFVDRTVIKQKDEQNLSPEAVTHKEHNGLLLACGMVAGAALVGVILAIPFAIAQSSDVLVIVPASFEPYADVLSAIVSLGLIYWIYHAVCKSK